MSARAAHLRLDDLCVHTSGGLPIVEGVTLELERGEILGLVGESGSGKTTTALALFGFAPPGTRITRGSLAVGSQESFSLVDAARARRLRGRLISYIPQSPGTSLNPGMRIGALLREMQDHRGREPGSTAAERAAELEQVLATVGLPGDRALQRRFPHQLSGGQQQRICFAIALLSGAEIIVLDEPTTGLDVVTQATVLDELRRLQRENGVSMVYISHDLAVVGALATKIAVMYAGRIVESGPTADVLSRGAHPYTRGLLNSTSDHRTAGSVRPMPGVAPSLGERQADACLFAPRCARATDRCTATEPSLDALTGRSRLVRCCHPFDEPFLLERSDVATTSAGGGPVLDVKGLAVAYEHRGAKVTAVHDVTFALSRGECLAVVGESGSGKTTLARAIAGLQTYSGEVALHGQPLGGVARHRSVEQRRLVQIVFQNPTLALNPRESVRTAIERSRRLAPKDHGGKSVEDLLDLVRLSRSLADRLPRELSGGERQRVGIARALAAEPEVVICDEITSALDVSVQAAVLALLRDLREQLGVSLLFITHDLGVVANLADRILVIERGVVCETGSARSVLDEPQAAYTQRLMEAAPSLGDLMVRPESHPLSSP